MKDCIIAAVNALHAEVGVAQGLQGRWRDARDDDPSKVALAWYHVTYHPDRRSEKRFLSFPLIVCNTLQSIKGGTQSPGWRNARSVVVSSCFLLKVYFMEPWQVYSRLLPLHC